LLLGDIVGADAGELVMGALRCDGVDVFDNVQSFPLLGCFGDVDSDDGILWRSLQTLA